MKEYPEKHQEGSIEINQDVLNTNHIYGDIGIQIARDGRIWLCINGQSAIRFKPLSKTQLDYMKKRQVENV